MSEQEIDIIDAAAAMMLPDPRIAQKMGLSYEEEQVAYLRLAKGVAVFAIKALSDGDAEKMASAKSLFLNDFEQTLNDAMGETDERS